MQQLCLLCIFWNKNTLDKLKPSNANIRIPKRLSTRIPHPPPHLKTSVPPSPYSWYCTIDKCYEVSKTYPIFITFKNFWKRILNCPLLRAKNLIPQPHPGLRLIWNVCLPVRLPNPRNPSICHQPFQSASPPKPWSSDSGNSLKMTT